MHFEINGEYKGVLFEGVDSRVPLWAYFDFVSDGIVPELLDPLNPSHRQVDTSSEEESLSNALHMLTVDVLPLPNRPDLVPLNLHRTKGLNVKTNHNGEAERFSDDLCDGYVFTEQPVKIGQTIIIQVLDTEVEDPGGLAIGLTSCDPASLKPGDLPEDSEALYDRPEYWVVQSNAAIGTKRGDELALTLTCDGEFKVRRNTSPAVTLWHVDLSVPLWAFVDVYGATRKVRLLTSLVLDISSGNSSIATNPSTEFLRALDLPRTNNNVQVRHSEESMNRVTFFSGYMFTSRQITIGSSIYIKILATENDIPANLAIGLTSCDPTTIPMDELPNDTIFLYDRPEYWVVDRTAAVGVKRGDELILALRYDVKFQVNRNSSPDRILWHVDYSVPLWAFVQVSPASPKIKMTLRLHTSDGVTSLSCISFPTTESFRPETGEPGKIAFNSNTLDIPDE